MKAEDIMKESMSINDRAGNYAKTIKRKQKQVIDALTDKKEHLEDMLASQLDFSLNVDINKGVAPITREEAERRFTKALELEYDLKLLILELEAKQAIYDKYFTDEKA